MGAVGGLRRPRRSRLRLTPSRSSAFPPGAGSGRSPQALCRAPSDRTRSSSSTASAGPPQPAVVLLCSVAAVACRRLAGGAPRRGGTSGPAPAPCAGGGLQSVGRPPRAPRGSACCSRLPSMPWVAQAAPACCPARCRGCLRRAPAGDEHPGRARRAAAACPTCSPRLLALRWAHGPRSRHQPRRPRTGRRGRADRGRRVGTAAGAAGLRHARHRSDAGLDDAVVRLAPLPFAALAARARSRALACSAHAAWLLALVAMSRPRKVIPPSATSLRPHAGGAREPPQH